MGIPKTKFIFVHSSFPYCSLISLICSSWLSMSDQRSKIKITTCKTYNALNFFLQFFSTEFYDLKDSVVQLDKVLLFIVASDHFCQWKKVALK